MIAADLTTARETTLALVLRGDRAGAAREAAARLAGGVGLADYVLDVLAPVQAEVGRRWQAGLLTTRDERLATEIAEFLLTSAAQTQTPRQDGAHLALCVADRDHHNLPARMVAELLRLEGHRVTFVGSARPGASLASLLTKLRPDAVVMSCSLAMNLPDLMALAAVAHAQGIPVIGGGRAFAQREQRAERLGLDAHAALVSEVAERVAAVGTAPAPPSVDPERHDQFLDLRSVRRELTDELTDRYLWQADRLLSRPLRDPRHVRDHVTNLLRFVEAAVLCDEQIVAEYVAWLRERFAALRVDAAAASVLVATVRDRLAPDLPLAGVALDGALSA